MDIARGSIERPLYTWLIILVCLIGGMGALLGVFLPGSYIVAIIAGAAVGGTSNPLYALLIAYANDYLERDDMAAASGGLLFVNGVGAIAGPLIVGFALDYYGPPGFWAFLAVLMLAVAFYALFRMTRRSRADLDLEQVSYVGVSPATTPIVAEMAQEAYIEAEMDEDATS